MKLKMVFWKTEVILEVTPENPENRVLKNPEKTYKNRRSRISGKRDFKSALSTYSNTAACMGIVARFSGRVKGEMA